jgi:regulator of replication initiation timing
VEHGEWLPLLQALRISDRTAQRLMKIAANEVLANPSNLSHLPSACWTLYELATLPTEVLEAKIADGTITPDTERKDVARLKAPEDEDEAEDVVGEASAPEAEAAAEDADDEISDAEEDVEEEASDDAEELHRLRREVSALQSENEELRHEREQLRLRVDELEHALMLAGQPKRKRGRPPGSKNKPKVQIEDGSDCGPMPESLRRAS